MEKKSSNLVYIITIVILAVLVLGMGIYIVFSLFKNDTENKKVELKPVENTVNTNVEIKKDLIKSETYVTDLNHDNIKEQVTIDYYGKNDEIGKIEISLDEENKHMSYEIEQADLEIKYGIKSQIVDINTEDNYSELLISGNTTKTNGKYISTIFLTYNRNELKPIKVNYEENAVKTYNYTLNKNKDVQYIRTGSSVTKQSERQNKIYEEPVELEIENNSVTVISNSGKQEVYTLNSEHELVLKSHKLVQNKEFYQNYLNATQNTIKVYGQNDINSQSYGAQETKEAEVIEVLNDWLKLKVTTGAIVYAYSEDIAD